MHEELTVLLIEDHPLIREGCRRILGLRRGTTTAEASSAAAGLQANSALKPDVAILDVALPDRNGLEIVEPLLAANSRLKIIVLSMHVSSGSVDRALRGGVAGYLSKADEPGTIVAAVDAVMRGETFVGSGVERTFGVGETSEKRDPLLGLTRRERRILSHLGRGRSLAEVSADVGLSCKTISNAVTLIKHKLRTPTKSALIMLAVEHAAGNDR